MKANRLSLMILGAICVLLTGACAQLEGGPKFKVAKDQGVTYYLPKTQFVTSYAQDGDKVVATVTRQIAPDYSRPYTLRLKPGLLSHDVFDIQLTDTGLLGSIGADSESKVEESVKSVGSFIVQGGSLAGLGFPFAKADPPAASTKLASGDRPDGPTPAAPILLASATNQPLLLAKAESGAPDAQTDGECPTSKIADEINYVLNYKDIKTNAIPAALHRLKIDLKNCPKKLTSSNQDLIEICAVTAALHRLKAGFENCQNNLTSRNQSLANQLAKCREEPNQPNECLRDPTARKNSKVCIADHLEGQIHDARQTLDAAKKSIDQYTKKQDKVFQRVADLVIAQGSSPATSRIRELRLKVLAEMVEAYWDYEQTAAKARNAQFSLKQTFWEAFLQLSPEGADSLIRRTKAENGCGLAALLKGGPARYLGKTITHTFKTDINFLFCQEKFAETRTADCRVIPECAESPKYINMIDGKWICFDLSKKMDECCQNQPLATYLNIYSDYLEQLMRGQQEDALRYRDGGLVPARNLLQQLMKRLNFIYDPYAGYEKARSESWVLPEPLQGQVKEGSEERQTVNFYARQVQDALTRFSLRQSQFRQQAVYQENRAKAFETMSTNWSTLRERLDQITILRNLLAEKPTIKQFEARKAVASQLETAVKNFRAALRPDLKSQASPQLLSTPRVIWLSASSPLPLPGQVSGARPGEIFVFVRPLAGK